MKKILTFITLLALVTSGSAMANSSNFQRMQGSHNHNNNGNGMNHNRMADNSDQRQKMGRGGFQADSRDNDKVSNSQLNTGSQYKQRHNMMQKQNGHCQSGRNN